MDSARSAGRRVSGLGGAGARDFAGARAELVRWESLTGEAAGPGADCGVGE